MKILEKGVCLQRRVISPDKGFDKYDIFRFCGGDRDREF